MNTETDTRTCPTCRNEISAADPPNFCPTCGEVLNPHLRRIADGLLATDAPWLRARVASGSWIIAASLFLIALLILPTILWRPFDPTAPWRAFAYLALAALWMGSLIVMAKGIWRTTSTDAPLRRALGTHASLVVLCRVAMLLALITILWLTMRVVWKEYDNPAADLSFGERLIDGSVFLRLVAGLSIGTALAGALMHRWRLDRLTGSRDASRWSWPLLAGIVVLLIGGVIFTASSHPLAGVILLAGLVSLCLWSAAWFTRAARRSLGNRPATR